MPQGAGDVGEHAEQEASEGAPSKRRRVDLEIRFDGAGPLRLHAEYPRELGVFGESTKRMSELACAINRLAAALERSHPPQGN